MPTIILTRTAEECRRSAPAFEACGLRVIAAPMVELRPLEKDMCGTRSMRRLTGGEPVLLTSAFATDLWLDMRETDFREHPPAGYWVVGSRSAALLREVDPDVPIKAVADSAEELLSDPFEGVARILYPCSTERRDTMVEGLRARGVEVYDMPIYHPARPADARDVLAAAIAEAGEPCAIAFFSPSAVKNFYGLGMQGDIPSGAIFSAIGAVTAAELAAHGVHEPLVPERPTAEALAHVVAAAFADRAV